MKIFLRWTWRVFIVVAILFVAGILLLDTVARNLLEHRLESETGLTAKVGSVNIGLLHPNVTVKNVVLYNTAEFGGSPFLDLPELHAEYDRSALWSHKLHCKLVRFHLAQVNLVEEKSGRRNFDFLRKKVSMPANPPAQSKDSAASSELTFDGIDTLNLTLGKVTYLRLAQPDKLEELNLKIDHQIFHNVKSEDDVSSILFVALMKSGINLMQSGNSQTWMQLLAPK